MLINWNIFYITFHFSVSACAAVFSPCSNSIMPHEALGHELKAGSGPRTFVNGRQMETF